MSQIIPGQDVDEYQLVKEPISRCRFPAHAIGGAQLGRDKDGHHWPSRRERARQPQ